MVVMIYLICSVGKVALRELSLAEIHGGPPPMVKTSGLSSLHKKRL